MPISSAVCMAQPGSVKSGGDVASWRTARAALNVSRAALGQRRIEAAGAAAFGAGTTELISSEAPRAST